VGRSYEGEDEAVYTTHVTLSIVLCAAIRVTANPCHAGSRSQPSITLAVTHSSTEAKEKEGARTPPLKRRSVRYPPSTPGAQRSALERTAPSGDTLDKPGYRHHDCIRGRGTCNRFVFVFVFVYGAKPWEANKGQQPAKRSPCPRWRKTRRGRAGLVGTALSVVRAVLAFCNFCFRGFTLLRR